MEIKSLFKKLGLVAGSTAVATQSFAAGTDFTSLTTAVDFSSAITAVLAVGVNIILVYVAIKGLKMVIGAVKG